MSKDKSKGPTRRTFLKTSGLAAVSTAFAGAEQTSKDVSAPGQPHRDPVDWVNILQGTASTQEFSRGNTLPIAALPFGMAHWTMQSHEDTPWMFQPGVRRIQGIRCTHQLSPWLSDYGQATFLPFTWGSPYVEGAAWQHRWDAPQNIPAMVESMGGGTEAAKALQEMLSTPPVFHVGVYGIEIHEMSEMAAVPFGQYAHSNQPVHHLLYLFSHAGRPDLAQLWVRKVMQTLYTPDTFAGDEDTGSMSAWFVLSAMGFYPVCPGKPEYTLGSPLFPRALVHLPGGVTFTIEAKGNTPDTVYVRRASLGGKPLLDNTLDHAAIVRGGTLLFEMASTSPNAGASAEKTI